MDTKKEKDNTTNEPEEEIKDLQAQLKDCSSLKEEYLDGWRRARADFENYRKEEALRAEMLAKFANEAILKDFVLIMDSFDLAIAAEPENQGVTLIRSQFEGLLGKNGLVPIKAIGEMFNPEVHESLGEEESDYPNGTVIKEIERGWKLYEKVLRPARVKLARLRTKAEQ